MPYNPFDKLIDEAFDVDDVQKLIEHHVAEGYYVEYKGHVFPANEKIGRSIASFANTYGGWYIVGVQTDAHNVATNICGFDTTIYPDPISKVREVVKSYIDPVPVFYLQVVGLAKDKAVLVVYIPPNQEAPFISKDGCIYRRTHDSSDPVPETSRYSIDRLVDDGRRIAKQFEKFCHDERTFSKGEAEEISWVNLFLSPYPLGTVEKLEVYSSKTIETLLEQSRTPFKIYLGEGEEATGNVPFNIGQTTLTSVVLQQLKPSRAAFNSLSIELFYDGRAKIHIPLEYIPSWKWYGLRELKSPEVIRVLKENWSTDDRDVDILCLRFFDFPKLWSAIITLLAYYHQWIGEKHLITDIKCAVRIKNVWRAVPFFDSDEWGIHVEKFGLPVVKTDAIVFPQDLGKGMVISYKNKSLFWQTIFGVVGLAFGLPLDIRSYAITHSIKESIENKDNDFTALSS